MRTRRRAIVLAAVIFWTPALALAADNLQKTASDLKTRAEKTITAVDAYLLTPVPDIADLPEALRFREFVRELRDAMTSVVKVSTLAAATDAETFGLRFDSSRVTSGDLVDIASRGRLDRFIPVEDAPACCDSLTKAAAPSEHAFAVALADIWKGFGPAQLQESIKVLSEVYKRFEAKLLNGFPAMPWEYMLNFRGDRNGPSPHQIIWAHPSLGFEFDNEAADGTSQARPVLAVQLGYNRYFFKGINYLGAAAILTVNATEGRDRWRKGAAVHLGNVASVGLTHGDDRWILFVASDRLGDKLVGALVKLR